MVAPILGHVGDGNYHMLILVDPGNPEDIDKAERISHAIVKSALKLEGTCSGKINVRINLNVIKKENMVLATQS